MSINIANVIEYNIKYLHNAAKGTVSSKLGLLGPASSCCLLFCCNMVNDCLYFMVVIVESSHGIKHS